MKPTSNWLEEYQCWKCSRTQIPTNVRIEELRIYAENRSDSENNTQIEGLPCDGMRNTWLLRIFLRTATNLCSAKPFFNVRGSRIVGDFNQFNFNQSVQGSNLLIVLCQRSEFRLFTMTCCGGVTAAIAICLSIIDMHTDIDRMRQANSAKLEMHKYSMKPRDVDWIAYAIAIARTIHSSFSIEICTKS